MTVSIKWLMASTWADTLRSHGFAVMVKDKDDRIEFRVSDPSKLMGDREVFSHEAGFSLSRAYGWADLIDRLEVELTKMYGRGKARSICEDCKNSLHDAIRGHGMETIRDAYLERHPDSKVGKFINPLMTFDDMVSGGTRFLHLVRVSDDSLHRDIFKLVGERYGISPDDVCTRASKGYSIIRDSCIAELKSDGAILNENNGKLAVSWIGCGNPQILVFDCTAEELARITMDTLRDSLAEGYDEHDALGDLFCQNFCADGALGDDDAKVKSYRTIDSLAASGFFRGSEAHGLTNASSVKDLNEIVKRELGIDLYKFAESRNMTIPAEYAEELKYAGALLNESANKLAVSWLPYEDPEIIVFDCTAEELAHSTLTAFKGYLARGRDADSAFDELYCQNGILDGKYKSYRSVEELAASGFFRGVEAHELTKASSVKDLNEIVKRELGIDLYEYAREASRTQGDLMDLAEGCRSASMAFEFEAREAGGKPHGDSDDHDGQAGR